MRRDQEVKATSLTNRVLPSLASSDFAEEGPGRGRRTWQLTRISFLTGGNGGIVLAQSDTIEVAVLMYCDACYFCLSQAAREQAQAILSLDTEHLESRGVARLESRETMLTSLEYDKIS